MKKNSKYTKKTSNKHTMNQDGDFDSGDSSNMVEEFLNSEDVEDAGLSRGAEEVVLQAVEDRDPTLVCVDTGANIPICKEIPGIADDVRHVEKKNIGTAKHGGMLRVNNLFNLGMLRNVRHCPDARANILNGNSIVDCGCEARLYGSKGNYRCEIVRKGAAEGLGEEYDFIIPCILLNGLWWITEAQFHDLVFRHGLTIEEIQSRHDEAVAWQLETMERRGGDFFKRNSVEIHLSDENFMSRMITFI